MAKNKKKSFSKVSVSQVILNSSDKNESIKLDINENKLLSEEAIELPKALTSDEYTETIKQLETSEYTETIETLCNEDNHKVPEANLDIEYVKNNEVNTSEIIEPDVTQDQNISNNDKKNTVELTEIQIINEESVTHNKNSTNCGRKYCSML
jgi:hypothetical protein